MTCENCIHYDLCNALEMNGIARVHPIQCGYFNDKSRYIKLPCKVGDTLYDIYDAKLNGGSEIQQMKVTEIHINLDKRNKPWIIISGYYFAYDDFGKYVFFNKEYAEKALAERSNL